MSKSIGALEFISISRGMFVADAVSKKANVEIIYFKTICPGKFLVIFAGDEGEVEEAINYGEQIEEKAIVDSFKVHAVSDAIVEAFRNRYGKKDGIDALGIVETRKVCTGIKALDLLLKAADVKLLKIYLAFAIGGKLVFIVTGSVSSIESGIAECKTMLSEHEIANIAIIPSPSEEMIENLFHTSFARE